MLRPLVALLVAAVPARAQEPAWHAASDVGGVRIDTREVAGSAFEEIRITRHLASPPQTACAAIWARELTSTDSWLPKREVVRETPTDRWFYERVAAPVVDDRDYTVHVWRESESQGGCVVKFDLDNGQGPAPKAGVVRMAALRGSWVVTEAARGGALVVYTLFNDPGGHIPACLSHGSQRARAADWVQMTLALLAASDAGPP